MNSDETEVRDHVKSLISKILAIPPSEIKDDRILSEYGLNSIDMIDVVVALQAKYQVQFDPDSMKDVTCRLLSANVLSSQRVT